MFFSNLFSQNNESIHINYLHTSILRKSNFVVLTFDSYKFDSLYFRFDTLSINVIYGFSENSEISYMISNGDFYPFFYNGLFIQNQNVRFFINRKSNLVDSIYYKRNFEFLDKDYFYWNLTENKLNINVTNNDELNSIYTYSFLDSVLKNYYIYTPELDSSKPNINKYSKFNCYWNEFPVINKTKDKKLYKQIILNYKKALEENDNPFWKPEIKRHYDILRKCYRKTFGVF